jgi:hypothetical protein
VECRVVGRSRIRACLHVVGRFEFEDVMFEGGGPTITVNGGLMVGGCGRFVVGCACWRHTTRYDGAWV